MHLFKWPHVLLCPLHSTLMLLLTEGYRAKLNLFARLAFKEYTNLFQAVAELEITANTA